MKFVKRKNFKIIKLSEWVCSCGQTNPDSQHTCSCGLSNDD